METLKSIEYAGKSYQVAFKQTPNWSHTSMSKKGLVYHATTSNNYDGSLAWLTNPQSSVSALFLVGREVGQITQLGYINQKFWHAGKIFEPHARFKKIAIKNDMNGNLVNPNLYLDGVEFSGGVDSNKDGKVTKDEIALTEWQYTAGVQIARWHAKVCGYELTEETQIIHQDIASYKPDLAYVLDEIKYRLFKKDEDDKKKQEELQIIVTPPKRTFWSVLLEIIKIIFNIK